jgi:peroxiredoxin/sulfur relay (sulfurtransferase) DsrC/TusE family protein
MKILTLLSSFAILILTSVTVAQKPINVSVSGNIFNSKTDTVMLSQYFGSGNYKDYAKAVLKKGGDFAIKTELPYSDYYVLRLGDQHINLILREGSDIKIYGDGADIFNYSNIVGSDESASMNEFIKAMTLWNHKRDNAVAEMQRSPDKQEEINSQITQEYYNFQATMQSFIAKNQNSPALIPVINMIDVENDFGTYESIVMQLNTAFKESPAVQNVYANYQQIKAKKDAANLLAPGKLAPDFEELMTDGKTKMKLSDLRGKVVLIDFWASWCGPCRKENPNVVRTYEKYKEAGFTVMSVSLDRDRAAWLAAIEKDKLTWPNHVSDLGHWSSRVPQMYGVKGIPFTVLIDQEGKVIRTNLRGEALEQELSRIYGF